MHQAAAFLDDDPDGLRAVLAAIDALREHPTPMTLSRSAPPDCAGYASAGTGCSTPSPTTSSPSATSLGRPPTADPLGTPMPRLSWNQTWCEPWLTAVARSSHGNQTRDRGRR
jgi:hypothetical protein